MNDEQKPQEHQEADIVVDENGEVSEPEPQKIEEPTKKSEKDTKTSPWQRFATWYKTHKKLSIPLTIVLLLLILAVVPATRYKLAALVLKNDLSIQIVDSVSATPVSGADVEVGSTHAVTDGTGKAVLHHVKVGDQKVVITKKYYKNNQSTILVPIFKQKTIPVVQFVATGRQVKITVKNLIDHAVLENVDIKVAGINAKTDKSGTAVIVLPADTKTAKASLALSGYNSTTASVQVDDKIIKENDFNLTPSGKVYFLSKLSGNIDVVKTNLDGSDRQTVLAGTGREDDRGTVLLASRDWKYLALLSRRDPSTTNAKLYLISTATGTVSQMDLNEPNSIINLVGWSDHDFIYRVTRQGVQSWQPGGEAIKSFNADTKKVITLDQAKGEGTDQYDYASEQYGGVYQIGNNVIFDKFWGVYYGNQSALNGKQAGIYSVSADGGNFKALKTFSYAPNQTTYINSIPYGASQIYYQVTDQGTDGYYAYQNGKVTQRSDIADEYNQYYTSGAITYLESPSGQQSFWSEPRDGKNTLFVGDYNGQNGKQIATLSDYSAYGWYTDDYLLVSKDGSELYIMPKSGPDSQAVKITDYHKPAQTFNGYGGGYGGL